MTNTDGQTEEAVSGEVTEGTEVETSEGSNPLEDGPTEDVMALLEDTSTDVDDGTGPVPTEGETKESGGVDAVPKESSPKETEEVEVKDARFSKAFSLLNKREQEITVRENALKESSARVAAVDVASASFQESPVNYIKAQLSQFSNSEDPEVIEGAFQELYEAMTMHVLGADAPEEMKEQSQYNKLQRDFDKYKNEQQSEKNELEQSALESQRTVKVTQAQARIKDQLVEAKEQYPYLINQTDEDPGELVFEVVWQDFEGRREAGEVDPTPMTIEEAASKVNTHYQQLAQKWAKLIPSAPTTPTQPTGQPANNRPGSSRTLTNNNASVAPTVEGSSYIDDDEESKLNAMELLFS